MIKAAKKEVPQDAHDVSSEDSSADRMAKVQAQRLYEKKLSYVRSKRAANRRGVSIDGFCIIVILVMGFVTTLGLSPSLYVSAAITIMMFLLTMIPFYSHAQNVLERSDEGE